MEIIAQILGIIVTLLCIFLTQLKRKWQILLVSFIANFLNIVMFFLLNGITSAVMVSVTATLQCAINGYLSYKNKESSVLQKIIFMFLYIISGALQFNVFLDILPIIASLLFMLAVFQKTEQKMRLFYAGNAVLWIVYDAIIGTTAVFAQIFSLISICIALFRYRKR